MKKILSIMLISAMVSAIIPCSAMANTGETVIEITNIPGYQADVNHNGMTVTPEINLVSGETPAGYAYQWYAGDDGENILQWETEKSLTIHSQLPSGWLWFEATPLDSNGNEIGDSVKVKYISTYPMKGRTDFPELTAEQSSQYRNTPTEYLFEVDGVKFILLDRLHNGQFYVMMENSVGKRAFDTRGKGGYQFDPTAPENIAYWLNNDFLSGDYLPESVKANITEGNWTTEGDGDWGNSNRTHKVGLLSYSEYIGYLGRFGLWLSEYDSWPYSWEGFWLRTLNSNYRPFASAKNGGKDDKTGIMGKIYYFDANNAGICHVRPTFRLSADFFENVEVENAGEKVSDFISNDEPVDPTPDPAPEIPDGKTVIEIINVPGYQADVNHNGMKVTPEINVVSGDVPDGYAYQWYAGEDGNGILPWETKESITIHSQLPSGWLWFEATPLDSNGNEIGDSVKVKYISTYPMKGRTDFPELTAEQSSQYRNTPSEYQFEIDGVKLILLDRLHNGQYYVMMENSVGKRAFDTRGNGKQFDPSAADNIAYWLNNDFLSGDYLPESVKNHITNENWTTEGDGNWGNSNRTHKVGLLSYSEYIGYLGRFGLWLEEYDASYPYSWEGFWLRTLRNNSHAFASAKNGGVNNESGIMGKMYYFDSGNTGVCFVRPTFRLSADFFTENRIELVTAGEKVKQTIADCGLNELDSIYSKEELIENGIFKLPEVKGFSFKGSFLAGDTVECDYKWFSQNNAEEADSIYGYSLSVTPNGRYEDVSEGEKCYTISADDVGKYLTFYVKPCDENGISGELYRSKPVLISGKAKVIVTACSRNGNNVNVTLKNLTEDENTAVVVMAAVYNGDSLIGSYAMKTIIPAGEEVSLDKLSLGSAHGDKVKFMVWDSLESMKCIYLSDI